MLAQACVEPSANEYRKFPDVDASHTEMCERVSEVLTFVHGPALADCAIDPAEAAAYAAVLRDASPTAAFAAPAEPGSPM